MRRRLGSAVSSIDRRSLSQLFLDGVLVAIAYVLAFRLRFDGAAPPSYARLFDVTVPWAIVAVLGALAAFGLYQRHWTYVGRRDYEGVVKAAVVATAVVVVAIAILHPVQYAHAFTYLHAFRYVHYSSVAITLPAGVTGLFLVLQLALLCGARLVLQLADVGLRRTA